jgi:4-amino-4-deoxy-L-arabinose transferase-like glycosyltransferase
LNALLLAISLALLVTILVLAPSDGGPAILICLPLLAAALYGIHQLEDRRFLSRLFIGAFLVRVVIGTAIYVFHGQTYFGGDAVTYDFLGDSLTHVWQGQPQYQRVIDVFYGGGSSSGWGMMYMVAGIYKVVGRNMLATQFVNCALGAATAPLAYLMAMEIFPNKKVARAAAVLTAFFPSLIIWSCQGLKDGPIVFLLALSMLAILKLGDRFTFRYLAALALALCCLLTLRFYVFYIVALAGVAAFVLGRRRLTVQSFARQMIVITAVSLALGYFGVSHYATQQLDAYGSGEVLQRMRSDASKSAESGFGQDLDVSTTSGALSTVPVGLTYLLLAPFPWQFGSVRQMLTLPEMLVWWCAIPMLALGAWFTIRHRIREIAPIVIFTSLLTLTYSIVQGNVGTAYRQRAQLLVFYFIFVAVGLVLVRERREDQRRKKEAQREAGRGPRRRRANANDEVLPSAAPVIPSPSSSQ